MHINDLEKLSGKEAAYYGLIGAKLVKIKQDRVCSVCKRKIIKGHQAITAAKLMVGDKSYKQITDSGRQVDKSRIRKFRHWICEDCFKDLKVKKHMKINPDILSSEEYQNMSYEAQLDIAKKLYKNGDISAKEMQEIENELIDAMAFRDALSNEF